MNIEKSIWFSEGDNIALSVPFTKVNREKRTVSGFATLDNLDQTGDVVTAEASTKAFEGFRGNIREMHGSLAVGKMISFKPETYYDPISKNFYNGVYVDVYVSKGAQDTWEKVLDGTLSGFSIGGKILETDNEVNKSTGESVRFIKNYELIELSIVDSPANELCNVLSVQKVNGKMVFKGIAANVKTENIFYCEESDSVFISENKTFDSPITGKPAELIGWVESSDVNKAKEIDKILDFFKKSRLPLTENQMIVKHVNAEGGNEMSDIQNDVAVEETVVENTVAAEEAPAEAPAVDTVEASDETLEKAADVSEVEVNEPDFAKMLGDLKGFLSETLDKSAAISAEKVEEIKTSVDAFSKSIDARITDIENQHKALAESFAATVDTVEKRVDAVESETAIKKSFDLGGSQEVIKKSKWSGAFLGSVSELIN